MQDWHDLLSQSITTVDELKGFVDNTRKLGKVVDRYPMRINPYFFSLIQEKDDPIWRQCVPDPREITDRHGGPDPLREEKYSPVPGLTHRYPDKVLLLISNKCAVYCRFCTRKRKVGKPLAPINPDTIDAGIKYIEEHHEIRDVLLSGGDPLLLEDEEIDSILSRIRAIPHVEIIRIGTRVPSTLPQRVTPELCDVLRKYHPLYVNMHFNHPMEITPESERALGLLADAGLPLGSQTVLLKGVNDDPEVMKELFQRLIRNRVKPYYLFQADVVRGTAHFRTTVDRGIEIIQNLVGHTSGLAVPHYVIDAPGGGGKIPISPQYYIMKDAGTIYLKNFEGRLIRYREVAENNGANEISRINKPKIAVTKPKVEVF